MEYIRRKMCAIGLFLFFSVFAASAQTTVSGVVKDAKTGETIIGANIIEKGTANGTVSDFDGNFTLSVPANAILVVKYVGYKEQEIPVSGRTTLVIQLEDTSIALGEVVAIGYGSQKKKEVTGSVASLKPEDFNPGVKNNPMGLLQGKVAGLNISKAGGGDPTNTGYNIQIRGFSTLDKGAGTSPLYIVDGIPVNNIDNISPDEIASMDVLKDGSAAAIYGTRGTNGVIIITTKRGLDGNTADCGNTVVEYSAYVSYSMPRGETGMATASEFRDLESISGGKIVPVIYPNGDYSTDWMDEVLRDAPITHNHNVAISGGSQKFNYRGSVNYKDAQGVAKNSARNELIAKLAANQKALDGWLDLQYDFSYMKYRNDYFCGDFKQAATLNPTYPIYDESTTSGYLIPNGSGQSNPVASMNQKESYQDGNYFRGSVRASVNIKPVPGLKVSGFGALEEGDNYKYWYNSYKFDSNLEDAGKAGRETDRNINKLFEATADYVTKIGDHSIAAVLGVSYQNFEFDGSKMENGGITSDVNKYFIIENGDATKAKMNISSYRNSNTLLSQFGRINYNYAEKYLFSASLRREGSSRFGENNKWGYFPAVSAGWMITRESFMENIHWINELKLRGGFGVTGNNLNEDLRSLKLYQKGGTFWYNGTYVNTLTTARDANPNLKWERKFEYNLGVDFSFLKDRLYGTIDAYFRQTKDLLWEYDVDISTSTRYTYPKYLTNAGEIESKGLEISLSGIPIKTSDWEWITTGTIAFNNNKITKLTSEDDELRYSEMLTGAVGENGIQGVNTQKIVEGESVGTFYGYKYTGITAAGNLIYEKDEDGKNKLQKIGSAQPKFTFGWNNTVRYKNWDLSLFFRGVVGNDVLNVKRWAYGPQKSQGLNVFMEDVKGIGSSSVYRQGVFSDYYLENGSYIKLDNVTLGYNVPLKENKFVQKLRVYGTAQNVFTITGYSGIDPEVNTSSVWDSGIDASGFYPSISNFLLGVNITFK